MAFLDRFLPPWRHSDPQVRVAAVRELGKDDNDTLATIVRRDKDVRVRRAAIKKIDVPSLLLEVARSDADEELRTLASTRADEINFEIAISNRAVDECLRALRELSRVPLRITAALRTSHAPVREAVLAGLSEDRQIAELARRLSDVPVGLAAVARLDDPAWLQKVASSDAPQEVAFAALARVSQADALQAIAEDPHAHSAVRKKARVVLLASVGEDHPIRVAERQLQQKQLCTDLERLVDRSDTERATLALREAATSWQEIAVTTPTDPALEQRFQRACQALRDSITRAELRIANEKRRELEQRQEETMRLSICERIDALQGAEIPPGLAAAKREWNSLSTPDRRPSRDWNERFAAVVERCEQRQQRWQARQAFQQQMEELVTQAEALVARREPTAALRARATLEKRWEKLESSSEASKWLAEEKALQTRFLAAGEALKQQEESIRLERQAREEAARQKIAQFCEELEALASSETLATAAAERTLRGGNDLKEILRALPAAERDGFQRRIVQARQTIQRRAEELAVAEEWKRWANADVQQRLIERVETLLAGDDAREMFKEITRIEQEWKRFAVAPRNQSQALWNRFRTATSELRRRCDVYLAENLAKKEALCVAAEQLADSTQMNVTADAFRKLQAEWKEIGPVKHSLSDEIYERFRSPANRFFERYKTFQEDRRQQRAETLQQMQTLCEAAEALSSSNEWDSAAAEIKSLQARARELRGFRRSPVSTEKVAPSEVDVLRERFHAACNSFFDRYHRREETARAEALEAAEAVVVGIEELGRNVGAPDSPRGAELAHLLRQQLGCWSKVLGVPAENVLPMQARVQQACDAIEPVLGDELAEDFFDSEAHVPQREKLCGRLEKLQAALSEPKGTPTPVDLAERLRLSMAANTIGGEIDPSQSSSERENREAFERLLQKWQRLGPIVGMRARRLAKRFDEAAVALTGLRTGG